MKRVFKKIFPISLIFILVFLFVPSTCAAFNPNSSDKILVGYWHNFDNGTGIIRLKDVSTNWDVINVAFGESIGDRATIEFSPEIGTEEQFKEDISYLNSIGKKVVLSIGGQNGVVLLPDEKAKNNFIDSMISLIDKYGFDGIDIDLESGINLINNDKDFKNPKTPQIVNLISAVRSICNHYGPDFILSMAPETAYVQGGYVAYAGNWGAYLPIIHGLRDKLTYIHVQHYNAGGNTALDGNNYTQGTADYEVAMAEMLLQGFPVAGDKDNVFPPLRQEQVLIGLPACPSAAPSGGYIKPNEMKKALDYLMKGIPYGGKYNLVNNNGYPNFKGLMTWSINWDAKSGYEFSTSYREYFDNFKQPPVTEKPAVPTGLKGRAVGKSQINITWNSVPGATSYDLKVDNKLIINVSNPYKHINLKPGSIHSYQVRAVNSLGSSDWSKVISAQSKFEDDEREWKPNTSYKVLDIVSYKGVNYRCIQEHTSLIGWEPINAPTLWEKIN
ncbi:glycosyl hydrolase family 18 protein [Clostridium rectalis]|uniref:glycosyl hydrolase family 18 protein n=1 Tax=Clostridium rectalis TaxID=2040295 RepID=UPI000F64023E|nr:glycosyl hydrolase family 18 protein [Clostridium rectalis]